LAIVEIAYWSSSKIPYIFDRFQSNMFPQQVFIKLSRTKFKEIRPEWGSQKKVRTNEHDKGKKKLFISKRRRPQTSYIPITNSSTLYTYRIKRRHIKQCQVHITQYYTVRNIKLQRRSNTDMGFS